MAIKNPHHRRHWRRTAIGLSAAALLTPLAALADIDFHGFGQVVGATTLDNSHTMAQPTNLTYAADPTFKDESLFALQADMSLSPNISATAQVVARGNNDFQPSFELAFATYDFGDNLQIRAGRQRLPLYIHSPSRSVGQSYIWVRPPSSVYYEPADNFDGLSLTKSMTLGSGWSTRLVGVYGNFSTDETVTRDTSSYTATFTGTNMTGGSIDVSYRTLLHLRAEYLVSWITVSGPQLDSLFNLYRQLGLNQAADELAINDDYAYFRGLGFEFTPGNWLLTSEYVQTAGDHSFTPSLSSYYVTGGYSWGNLSAALTYQHLIGSPSYAALKDIPAGAACPTPTGQFVPGLCQTYARSFLDTNQDLDRYYELSLRYDLSPHAAIKLDYTAYNSGLAGRPSANLISTAFTFDF